MAELSDNPFAIRPRPRAWVTSLKGLLVVAGLLVVVLALQGQTRQWLLQRWVVGLSALPADQQIERLRQLDALGDLATATLARQVAADELAVAQTAAELLRTRQSEWATRDDDSLARAHGQMLEGFSEVAADLPPERARLVTPLLHQTILECVEQRGEAMRQTYATANALAARLAGDSAPAAISTAAISRSGIRAPEINAHEQRTVLPAPSLVPLPVRLQTIATASSAEVASAAAPPAAPLVAPAPPATPATRPEVARPIAQPVRVVAGPTPVAGPSQSAEPPRVVAAAQVAVHKQAVHQSPQPLSTRQVIQLLASKLTATHDQAVAELRRRGLSDEEIRIANQLAAPQPEVRLGLLESVATRTDIDPRPWLLWLAEDADRQVRLRAVTALAAMDDAAVQATLRKRLDAETDAEVLAQLRQVVQRR